MLLDTHTLIWFLINDEQLPQSIKSQIESAEIVYVSIASIWEISIKLNIGKLAFSIAFDALETNLIALNIGILPITFADTVTYRSLPLHHRDPFDRILIAQAMNRTLSLISQDTQLDLYSIQRLWA